LVTTGRKAERRISVGEGGQSGSGVLVLWSKRTRADKKVNDLIQGADGFGELVFVLLHSSGIPYLELAGFGSIDDALKLSPAPLSIFKDAPSRPPLQKMEKISAGLRDLAPCHLHG
jgi:hypothetical protein